MPAGATLCGALGDELITASGDVVAALFRTGGGGIPIGGVPPSPRRRIPSLSLVRRYGCSGARAKQSAQSNVQHSSESASRGATATPHHEQENGVGALKAPASARLGGVDRAARGGLVLVPVRVNLNVG
jgi:hypothetical protein